MYQFKLATLFSYLLLFVNKRVLADYCKFGTCDANIEYCCGENKCCKKTVDVWYYWAVVLLIIIIISIAACYYFKRIKNKYKTYTKLEQHVDEPTSQA